MTKDSFKEKGQLRSSDTLYIPKVTDAKWCSALMWRLFRKGKYKLVHEKENDVFIWNLVSHSKELDRKIKAIRKI